MKYFYARVNIADGKLVGGSITINKFIAFEEAISNNEPFVIAKDVLEDVPTLWYEVLGEVELEGEE